MNQKGFTLMELLITVMIVGILSSIALPQYMRSLERARATEAMTAIKALNDAVYAYAAGRPGNQSAACPTGFQKLATVLPYRTVGSDADGHETITTRDFTYTLNRADTALIPGTPCPGVTAERTGTNKYQYILWNPYLKGGTTRKGATLACCGLDEPGKGVCESLDLTSATSPYGNVCEL